MNKTYNINSYESNCTPIRIKGRTHGDSSVLEFLSALIGKLFSENFISIVRAVVSVLCFIAFVGIVGGVDSGSVSLGYAVIISALLVIIELFCLVPHGKDH